MKNIWVQLHNNGEGGGGGLFVSARLLYCFIILTNFQFSRASMIIKVDKKVIFEMEYI